MWGILQQQTQQVSGMHEETGLKPSMTSAIKADKTLDCTGLFCPMPIVRTKQEMSGMKSGEVLEIMADDPGFAKDLPAWCGLTGEKFLEIRQDGPVLTGYVAKK
jgi:tRNA 2-thiouridine synthesizing protein A